MTFFALARHVCPEIYCHSSSTLEQLLGVTSADLFAWLLFVIF